MGTMENFSMAFFAFSIFVVSCRLNAHAKRLQKLEEKEEVN